MANIAVIEKNVAVRSGVCRVLQREDHEVIHYNNSEDALEALTTQEYPVYLISKEFPGSLELIQEVQEHYREREQQAPRAIVMSGKPSIDKFARYLRAGAEDCVVLPCTSQELMQIVNKELRNYERAVQN